MTIPIQMPPCVGRRGAPRDVFPMGIALTLGAMADDVHARRGGFCSTSASPAASYPPSLVLNWPKLVSIEKLTLVSHGRSECVDSARLTFWRSSEPHVYATTPSRSAASASRLSLVQRAWPDATVDANECSSIHRGPCPSAHGVRRTPAPPGWVRPRSVAGVATVRGFRHGASSIHKRVPR